MTENEKIAELLKLLSDPAEDVRANAARALAQTSALKATDFLMRALEDSSPSVRIQAAAALGALESGVAATAIGLLMADEFRSVRKAAAEALAQLGDPGFAILATGSQSENPLVRQSSAFGLARCPRERSIGLLVANLQDPNENVRYYAADSLGILRAEQALEPLIEALQRQAESEEVRKSISDAIVTIGGEKALRLLLKGVNHSDETARRWTCVALEDLEASERR